MSESMVIKDLKEAYYMHSGLAFSADETYDLWAEFDARDRRIAELEEAILERGIEMGKSYRRITDLEAENAGLKERVAMLDVTAVFKSLGEMGYIEQTNRLHARIAELEAYIDQLIEIGGWAITGMTIATSYSPGEMQNLAEKKSDDWYALIKNLKECDKEKEREE